MAKRTLIPHIRNFIKGSSLVQLKKMKKELSDEIERGLLKDRPEHSYTLELEFIEKQIKAKSKSNRLKRK
tara:strand:- start:303 stop:512 length:210 start_codon:yes stop_codon:yes gene_type:complete